MFFLNRICRNLHSTAVRRQQGGGARKGFEDIKDSTTKARVETYLEKKLAADNAKAALKRATDNLGDKKHELDCMKRSPQYSAFQNKLKKKEKDDGLEGLRTDVRKCVKAAKKAKKLAKREAKNAGEDIDIDSL